MSKIDFENLLNPVGSVHHKQTGNKGLSNREFDYSANNPAMGIINDMIQSGNYHADDIADLYDAAAQWEIDRSNWIDQLNVDQAIKEEQRAYDSPLQQVGRAREAGINLDIQANGSGGVGAGSAGNTQGATSPDNQDQIGRTDNYASKYYSLAVVQTVADFMQSMATSTSQVMDSISQMQNVSSLVKLNDAQTNLYNAQANEINSLLDGKVESQELGNVDHYMGQIYRLSNLLQPNFTDDQATSLFNSANIDPSLHAGYMDSIRQVHQRPEILADWHDNQVRARYSAAENREYNDSYVTRTVQIIAQANENQITSQLYQSQMDAALNKILSTDESYTSDLADTMMDQANLGKQQVEQSVKEFTQYVTNYGERLDASAAKCREIDGIIAEYEKKRQSRPNKKLTAAEEAYLASIKDERLLIRFGAANDMMMFTNSMNRFNRKVYIANHMLGPSGDLLTLNGRQKIEHFNQGMFDDIIAGVSSGGQIARDAASTVGNIAMLMFGAQGLKSGVTSMLKKPNPIGFHNSKQGIYKGSTYMTSTGMMPF